MRLSAFQEVLKENHLDAFLIEDPIHLLYFTGLKLSSGKLLIKPDKAELSVDLRYTEVCKKEGFIPLCTFEEENLKGRCIGFDEKAVSAKTYLEFKSLNLIPKSLMLRRFRSIKDKTEIKLLQASAYLLMKGFHYLRRRIKEGVTEIELAKAFEIFCLKQGADGLSFDPIIAFGAESSMPHYRPKKKNLKKNQIVLMDLGIVKDGYASDMTRVLFFGKKDSELDKIYHIVRDAQRAAINACLPKTPFHLIDKAARDVIEKSGYGAHFLHSTGHGIGLEVHEYPLLRNASEGILETGMVITVEPGIYLPAKGGVRWEDMILITERKPLQLT